VLKGLFVLNAIILLLNKSSQRNNTVDNAFFGRVLSQAEYVVKKLSCGSGYKKFGAERA
jgi:hypothetical protein